MRQAASDRYTFDFDVTQGPCGRGRFVVRIFSADHPDFMAGSYYDSTFLDIRSCHGLQMMGGQLTAAEVTAIQDGIRIFARAHYGY